MVEEEMRTIAGCNFHVDRVPNYDPSFETREFNRSRVGAEWYSFHPHRMIIYIGQCDDDNPPGTNVDYIQAELYSGQEYDQYEARMNDLMNSPDYLPIFTVVIEGINRVVHRGYNHMVATDFYNTYVNKSKHIPGSRAYRKSISLRVDGQAISVYKQV